MASKNWWAFYVLCNLPDNCKEAKKTSTKTQLVHSSGINDRYQTRNV